MSGMKPETIAALQQAAEECMKFYGEYTSYFHKKAVLDCVATIRWHALGGTGARRHDPAEMEKLESETRAKEDSISGCPINFDKEN